MSGIIIKGLKVNKDRITLTLYPDGKIYDTGPFGQRDLSYMKYSSIKDTIMKDIHNEICKDCKDDCNCCKLKSALNFLSKYEF